MNNPGATYRLQFNGEFNFEKFAKIIPFLEKLGISTVYASPIFKSTPGSTHGYDGVNPNEIDPEIGTLADLKSLSALLKEKNISWLQDIVPNHMAFHPENPWLMDVLEKGRQSVYAGFFDIAWNSRLFQGKLMVPFLGTNLNEELERGNVAMVFTGSGFSMQYGEDIYPLNARSYATFFNREMASKNQAFEGISRQVDEIEEVENPEMYSLRWNELRMQVASLFQNDELKIILEQRLEEVNADTTNLNEIIDQQTYVLCNWQKTEEQINFRRFFTVNDLICLNIQDEKVFETYHDLIKSLVHEGVFQGLRVDHIDGLFDPRAYLEHLRKLAGPDTYLVVEKILGKNEEMPLEWPVQGTTGYEFLAAVNNLLTNKSSEKSFTQFYQELTGNSQSVRQQLQKKKAFILFDQMGGELENLYQLFVELNLISNDKLEQIGKENLKQSIAGFLIHCPVYRYYGNSLPFSEQEISDIKNIFNDVRSENSHLIDAVDCVESALLGMAGRDDVDYNARALEFYQRCMQFTGPLMAKGGEDTLMYTNDRFIGHNDVGDSVENFGLSIREFHIAMKKRQRNWPLSLNTTSTHDTKRGEDVRARLNVLTDLDDEWFQNVKKWQEINASLRKEFTAPDRNDEYLIYQTIAGAYPMPGQEEDDFPDRFEAYLEKALREAKTNTTYAEPNDDYESGTKSFARKLLSKNSEFWKCFASFHEKIADYGIVNSLSQLVLKFMCPGIPDVYQGAESWDFSLVDPDNRRPVDFEKRLQILTQIGEQQNQGGFLAELWKDRYNSGVKLWLTQQLFELRKKYPLVFSEGEYVPFEVKGKLKNHIIAFARIYKTTVVAVVAPLHISRICRDQQTDILHLDWGDTKIVLPPNLDVAWERDLAGNGSTLRSTLLPGELFREFPVSVLNGVKADNTRRAGILLHISSLPSSFGIGDLGPESYVFADFLERTHQRVWQLLPLNPTEQSQGNSPYSALSSRAGNPTLISPEMLAADGLLDEIDLTSYFVENTGHVDFEKVEPFKIELLKKAFKNFLADPEKFPLAEYRSFCEKNFEWLEDFALYMVIRDQHSGKSWPEWEVDFKLRNEDVLKQLLVNKSDEIDFVKWVQYIFDKQWNALRSYCNARDITFLGDMPFYVSYNSADVWSHRELFMLDEEGKITGAAGVPPDTFSEDGQLWGMPVFNWDAMEKQGYDWWIQRLRKNVELFDITRLDHFRAFADYWSVPGGEKNARNGSWKLGPGSAFFHAVMSALGELPFVAEDLGEVNPAVYALRDEFNLRGMKVLQYAFEESMPHSDHIPHNYRENFIAYTGTHDNNTVKGWYRKEADQEIRKRLEEYLGKEINEDNISEAMIRLVYGSVAALAILPVQDVLNLDENSKMNSPGSPENNWTWRLVQGQLNQETENKLKYWSRLYNRGF